jgi:tRNA dimethylallyltransferase
VFRELEIGTAKPSKEELAQIPHHFINSRSIHDGYDAGTYGLDARRVLDELFQRHSTAILCGGSGLYIKALLEGFDDMPEIPTRVRETVIRDYEQKGMGWLQEEVRNADPDYFEVVDRNNPQRLMRSLEVIRQTGQPFSGFRRRERRELPFDVVKFGLTLDREALYKRIDDRMDAMIVKGLIEEAKLLFPLRHLPALQTVGYQEVFGFVEGQYDQEEAVRLLKRNSRNYAKRQMTWFRRDPEIQWFNADPDSYRDPDTLFQALLNSNS